MRRTYLVAFAVLVATFVALYPLLGAIGFCEHGDECPYVVQSSSTASAGLTTMCLNAVLAASPVVVLALSAYRGRRIADTDTRPEDIFFPPDPPPP